MKSCVSNLKNARSSWVTRTGSVNVIEETKIPETSVDPRFSSRNELSSSGLSSDQETMNKILNDIASFFVYGRLNSPIYKRAYEISDERPKIQTSEGFGLLQKVKQKPFSLFNNGQGTAV